MLVHGNAPYARANVGHQQRALPGRQPSVLGVSAVLAVLLVFELCPTPLLKMMVATPLLVVWLGVKISMALRYCARDQSDLVEDDTESEASDSPSEDDEMTATVEAGLTMVLGMAMGINSNGSGKVRPGLLQRRAPSRLQQLFRQYYVFDQAAGAVPRAISWFCFVALVLMLLMSVGARRLLHPWSLLGCLSRSCCQAAQAADWDTHLIQCHNDRTVFSSWSGRTDHTCVVPDADMLRDMCQLAEDVGWWRFGFSFWGGLALWCILRLKHAVLLSFVPLPQKPKEWDNDPKFLARIGAVIPCHQSEEEIAATCRSIMRYLPPQNIVVSDNANSQEPPDNTREVVKAVHPDIVYTYTPTGLKTLALYTGMQLLPPHVEYLMHMDDDTVLGDDMVFDEEWFRDKSVAEVTYPIFTREVNLLTSCLGFIFKLNSHASVFNNVTSGTSLWAPGIIGLVRRSVFDKVLPDHVFLPFGEDAFHGTLILANNGKIKRDARSSVVTFAPPVVSTVCARSVREQGYGACSLFKQRAQRWMVTKLRRMAWTFMLLFSYQAGSVWGNVWFRLSHVPEVLGSAVAVVAIPLAAVQVHHIVMSGNWLPLLWLLFKFCVGGYLVSAITLGFINYTLWRHRPDYQVRWSTILMTPLVEFFLVCCHAVGHTLAIIYWIPFVPTRVHVFTHQYECQGQGQSE